MRLVLDASVAVKLVVDEPGTPQAVHVLHRPATRLAPDWMRLEVASALWNKVRRGSLEDWDARERLAAVDGFIDEFACATQMLDEAFDLSLSLGHPVYDCMYLALAMRDDASVITADHDFVGAARRSGLEARVELLTW